MTWHALLLWSPEADVDADVLAIEQAAVDLRSLRVNIDVSEPGVVRGRGRVGAEDRVHLQARSAVEAREAVRVRVQGREVEVVVDG